MLRYAITTSRIGPRVGMKLGTGRAAECTRLRGPSGPELARASSAPIEVLNISRQAIAANVLVLLGAGNEVLVVDAPGPA